MESYLSRLNPESVLSEIQLSEICNLLVRGGRLPGSGLTLTSGLTKIEEFLPMLSSSRRVMHVKPLESQPSSFEVQLDSFRAAVEMYWFLSVLREESGTNFSFCFPEAPSAPSSSSQVPVPKSASKLTARFFILAEKVEGFDLAKKIIGVGGKNMKAILKACERAFPGKQQGGGTKLRLRGRGSNYLEGPLKRECDEQLHLCVSATKEEAFNQVCRAVEALIAGVAKQYASHCHSKQLPSRKHFFQKVVG